jgi:hypothetical protein
MSNCNEKTVTNQQLNQNFAANPAHFEIHKMWQIFSISESSVLELRALWPKDYLKTNKEAVVKHFCGPDYGTILQLAAAFESAAIKLNKAGYNIYVVMNPIKSSFVGSAITDDDIQHRDFLLIDIDRAYFSKEPATDHEVDAARQLAEEVQEFMEDSGFNNPYKVMSGNGYHLYYLLIEQDSDNTPESEQMVQKTLKSLAKKFDNKTVKIDTKVFNAGRITKVPGTIMRKGVESEGRPFRMAVVL